MYRLAESFQRFSRGFGDRGGGHATFVSGEVVVEFRHRVADYGLRAACVEACGDEEVVASSLDRGGGKGEGLPLVDRGAAGVGATK